MLETRTDNSGDTEMSDTAATAFISPSSSPGQPTGVVLPFLPSLAPHPSPPPTPSGSPPGQGASPSSSSSSSSSSFLVQKFSLHQQFRETGRLFHSQKQCQERYRGFSQSQDDVPNVTERDSVHDDSRDDDVMSDDEIDVIGDTDTTTPTTAMEVETVTSSSDSGCDVRGKDSDRDVSDSGDESKNYGTDVRDVVAEKSQKAVDDNDGGDDSVDIRDKNRRQESPTSVTNFSISAILKPDFGLARKLRLDFPQHPTPNTHHPQSRSSPHLSNPPLPPSPSHHHHPIIKPIFSLHAQYLHLHRQQQHQHLQHHHQSRPQAHHHHFHPRLSPLTPSSPRARLSASPISSSRHPKISSLSASSHPTLSALSSLSSSSSSHARLSPLSSSSSPLSPVDLSTRGRSGGGDGGRTASLSSSQNRNPRANLQPDLLLGGKRAGNINTGNCLSVTGKKPSSSLDKTGNSKKETKMKTTTSPTGNNNINNVNNNSSGNKNSPASVTPDNKHLWPAWVFCTRYSDRPSSGPRSRRVKRKRSNSNGAATGAPAQAEAAAEKRPRTAFTSEQLSRLKREFEDCRYLTETRRRHLASDLGLTESQIKIWFQNKRAKIKKSSGVKNELALQLMAQGLYNHSTITVEEEEEEDGGGEGESEDIMVC